MQYREITSFSHISTCPVTTRYFSDMQEVVEVGSSSVCAIFCWSKLFAKFDRF